MLTRALHLHLHLSFVLTILPCLDVLLRSASACTHCYDFLGFMQTFMGVILGSAVVPIALCITWRKANRNGCVVGAVAGFGAGLVAWLVTTSALNDSSINVTVCQDASFSVVNKSG